MEGLQLIITTVIGSVASMALFVAMLGALIKVYIEPIKENQARLEAGQARLEAKIDKLLVSQKKH